MLLNAKYPTTLFLLRFILQLGGLLWALWPEERSFLVKVNKDQSRQALSLSLSLSLSLAGPRALLKTCKNWSSETGQAGGEGEYSRDNLHQTKTVQRGNKEKTFTFTPNFLFGPNTSSAFLAPREIEQQRQHIHHSSEHFLLISNFTIIVINLVTK